MLYCLDNFSTRSQSLKAGSQVMNSRSIAFANLNIFSQSDDFSATYTPVPTILIPLDAAKSSDWEKMVDRKRTRQNSSNESL